MGGMAKERSTALEAFALENDVDVATVTNQRWYAVHCQPHRERIAAQNLAERSWDVFLPCREKTRRHARRIETVRAPFFPGYLFVCLDIGRQRWRDINTTFGVVRLVSQGDRPTPAPRGVIEALQNACNEQSLLAWLPPLQPGDKVKVALGPLAGLIGELDRMTDAGRVSVLLDMLGGRVPVFLPRAHVVPAETNL